MSKRKAEGVLERGIYCEGDTTEVYLAEATSTHQTMNIHVETSVEGGTKETPPMLAAAPANHVDKAGANLFWILLENARYTIW